MHRQRLTQGRRNYKCELPFRLQAWRTASPISTAAPPSRSCPGHWGCQLWSAMLVLTLHSVPVILKEALGRTVGSVQKRGGTRGIEGTGPKERKLAPTSEGPSIPPAPSVSPSGRCPFSSLPSPQRFLSLASSGWCLQYIRRQRVVLGAEDRMAAWALGLRVPRAPAPPSSPPRPPLPSPPRQAGRRRGVRAGLGAEGSARAASLRWSRRAEAEAVAASRSPRTGSGRGAERRSQARAARQVFLCEAAAASEL